MLPCVISLLLLVLFLVLQTYSMSEVKTVDFIFHLVLQVVPTVYTDINERIILSNQVIPFFSFLFCGQAFCLCTYLYVLFSCIP
jgi:hypothetical protein